MEILLSVILLGEWSTPGWCDKHRSVFTNVESSQARIFYNLQKNGSNWEKSENYLWWTEGNIVFHSKKNTVEAYPVLVLRYDSDKVVYCPVNNCDMTFEMVKCSS